MNDFAIRPTNVPAIIKLYCCNHLLEVEFCAVQKGHQLTEFNRDQYIYLVRSKLKDLFKLLMQFCSLESRMVGPSVRSPLCTFYVWMQK